MNRSAAVRLWPTIDWRADGMRLHRRLTVAGTAAALLLAISVGAASANKLSISHGSLFRIEWSGLNFSSVGGSFIKCALTLEGSIHSTTFAKVRDLLVGYITNATPSTPCAIGSATVLSETLPWHLTYRGFEGVLPAISAAVLSIPDISLKLRAGGFGSCLYRPGSEFLPSPFEARMEEPEVSGGEGNRIFRKLAIVTTTVVCRGVEGGSSATFTMSGTGIIKEAFGGSVNVLLRLI